MVENTADPPGERKQHEQTTAPRNADVKLAGTDLGDYPKKAAALLRLFQTFATEARCRGEDATDVRALELVGSLVFNARTHVTIEIKEQADKANEIPPVDQHGDPHERNKHGQSKRWRFYASRSVTSDAMTGLVQVLTELDALGALIEVAISAAVDGDLSG